MNSPREVLLKIEGDDVVTSQPRLLTDRSSRMMFRSVLGATPTVDGWRCPRRRGSIEALVIRVNKFLEDGGWTVNRVGQVDDVIRREVEKRRSFERTRDSASRFREGEILINLEHVKASLYSFGWDENGRSLLEHQEQGLLHALTAVNAANFSVPGSGKTATALAVAVTHLSEGIIDVVIVVGPLSSFEPWERETQIALGANLNVRRIRGTRWQRRAMYSSVRPRQLVLISYASAASDRAQMVELCRSHKVMLIVDESHRIKRFKGGIWAPALMEIARHARVRMILSGTPMPQGGRDLYSQFNILWPGGELTGPRDSFAAGVDLNFNSQIGRVQPFIFRTPKSALGLPDIEVTIHEVSMTGTQREIYNLIESNFRRRIDDAHSWRDKIEALKRGRLIRLLQAATNPDLLNKVDRFYNLPRMESSNPTLMERLARYHSTDTPAKSNAGLELVRQITSEERKVVCWSTFVHNLDQFSEIVRNNLEVPIFQIDGRVPVGDETADDVAEVARSNPEDLDTREQIIRRFLDTPGPAVLVANPASCSESISLHRSCHNAIYLDRTYDAAQFLQSMDRIHRLGLPEGVTVSIHILLATDEGRRTIDHLVDRALKRKETRMRQLLESADLIPFDLSEDPLVDAIGDDEDLGELLRFLLGEEDMPD